MDHRSDTGRRRRVDRPTVGRGRLRQTAGGERALSCHIMSEAADASSGRFVWVHDERWWTMAHVPLHDDTKGIIPRLARGYAKGSSARRSIRRRPRRTIPVCWSRWAPSRRRPRRGGKARPRAALVGHTGRRRPDRVHVVHRLRLLRGHARGRRPRKVRAVPAWRESSLFDERERVVLEYAEAATVSPARGVRRLAARLHAHFSDAEIVELAAWVALENFRSRFNAGLGLRSQGFAERVRRPVPSRQGV